MKKSTYITTDNELTSLIKDVDFNGSVEIHGSPEGWSLFIDGELKIAGALPTLTSNEILIEVYKCLN